MVVHNIGLSVKKKKKKTLERSSCTPMPGCEVDTEAHTRNNKHSLGMSSSLLN